MSNLIEQLKGTSERKKTQYAFLGALSVTLLVGAVWATSLPARFTRIGASESVGVTDAAESASFADLLETSKAQVGSVIEGVQDDASIEAEPDAEPYVPTTNAFDALAPSYNEVADVPPVEVSQRAPNAAITEPAVEASSTVTLLAKPAPQIIMIATTTSQKSE